MNKRAAVRLISLGLVLTALTGCAGGQAAATAAPSGTTSDSAYPDYYQYLGNIDYSTDAAALVWEQVEGEDPGVYGIQYRYINDFNGITRQEDIAVCLYFYSSAARGSQSLTAGVEDLAQTLVGRVLFIAVDGVEADAISTAYEIGGYPEFVLIDHNARISTFSGFDYEEWDIDDVSAWMTDNGFEPDTSMLLR